MRDGGRCVGGKMPVFLSGVELSEDARRDTRPGAAAARAQGRGVLARDGQRRVLVTGMPRSGTTWLGRVLARSDGAAIVHEPFNRFFGVPPIAHMFPLPGQPYDQVVDDFFLRRIWGRPVRHCRTLLSLQEIGRQKTAYWRAIVRPPSTLIVKDPSASFLAERMVARFGFRAVFVVRHPCALLDSFRRVGWDGELSARDLEAQRPDILGPWGGAAGASPARQLGMTWSLVNRTALDLARRCPDRVTLVWHEDLCRSPAARVASLLRFLDLAPSRRLRRYLSATTTGTVVTPSDDRVHHLVRDTASLPERWRDTLSDDDRNAIADTTDDVMRTLVRETA